MIETLHTNSPPEHPVQRISYIELKDRIENGHPLLPIEHDTEYTASFDVRGWANEHKVTTIAITGTAAAIGAAAISVLALRRYKKH